jgi:hypothetical protein
MPNRRRFLQAAVALSAAPAIGAAAPARAAARPLDLVIYDDRFAASRAFGQAALTLGARVRRISGDVTPLWTGELRQVWRERPAAIAGMTVRGALFCLEQLGWDARMRISYRQAHGPDAGGAWAAEAAQTVLHMPALEGAAPDMLTMAQSHEDEFTLYSWIIAPVNGGARARSV